MLRPLLLLLALSPVACGGSEGDPGPVGWGYFGIESSTSATTVFSGYYPAKYRGFPAYTCLTIETIGHCEVPVDCPPMPQPSPEEITGTDDALDTGEILIAGIPIPLLDGTREHFLAFDSPLPLGEAIPLSVAGSKDVPAHHGTFVIPAPITVTDPDLSAPLVVDRTSPLRVTWVPGSTGTVTVGIHEDVDSLNWVSCTLPASAGELVVPVEILSRLRDSIAEEGHAPYLVISQNAAYDLHPKDWEVYLRIQGLRQGGSVDVN